MAPAEGHRKLDEQWLREMRQQIRLITRQVDELELNFHANNALKSQSAAQRWFKTLLPALGGRPVDLCRTARGRRAVLRELSSIKRGIHS